MKGFLAALSLLIASLLPVSAGTIWLDGPFEYERGQARLSPGGGRVTVRVYGRDFRGVEGIQFVLKFINVNGQDDAAVVPPIFKISTTEGSELFGGQAIFINEHIFRPDMVYALCMPDCTFFAFLLDYPVNIPAGSSDRTWLMDITCDYAPGAGGPYVVMLDQYRSLLAGPNYTELPLRCIDGRFSIGSRDLYVDDDAPGDPGPGDPSVSDPDEDGSLDHAFDSIQEAIDAASDGDTVIVLDGTYTGTGNRDITFSGKEIMVYSLGGIAEDCIIDCEGTANDNHRGFAFLDGESRNTVLDGFTIKNAYCRNANGAGIYCRQSSPTISHCLIRDNKVDYQNSEVAAVNGGGIYLEHSSSAIVKNRIRGNTSYWHGGGISCTGSGTPLIAENDIGGDAGSDANLAPFGAGIYCGNNVCPTISRNTIRRNRTLYSSINNRFIGGLALGGAGLYCHRASSSTVIVDNSFLDNRPGEDKTCYGGAIFVDGASLKIMDNHIQANAARFGAGIYCTGNSSPEILRNRIESNSTLDPGEGGGIFYDACSPVIMGNWILRNSAYGRGGGLCVRNSSGSRVTSNIFAENRAETGGAAYIDISSAAFRNNTVVGNAASICGGIYCNWASKNTIVQSCIFWDNGTDFQGCTPRYSCFNTAFDGYPEYNTPRYPHLSQDYHLKSYSPCIDAGDYAGMYESEVDIDGDPRKLGPQVDIGADERTSKSPDADADGLPDHWEQAFFGGTAQRPNDDFDFDGLTNLKEYLSGTNPASPNLAIAYVRWGADPQTANGTIDHPYPSIQQGVDAASKTVRVAEARDGQVLKAYEEQVIVNAKALDIEGGYNSDFSQRDRALYKTVVDASSIAGASVFTFLYTAGGSITGFDEITGGSSDCGGGILCVESEIVISNNGITGNSATKGGGICCQCTYRRPIIADNDISANSADDGGGVYASRYAPQILGNSITGNIATGRGGAVFCESAQAALRISGNTMTSNISYGYGGAIYLHKCRYSGIGTSPPGWTDTQPWSGNVMVSNGAFLGGGAVCLSFCRELYIKGNIMATNSSGEGGAMLSLSSSSIVFENNTVADNAAP